jgi:hypothetical protein
VGLLAVVGWAAADGHGAKPNAGPDEAAKAAAHAADAPKAPDPAAAAAAKEELKNFKPEFYPRRLQARLYLRDKRLAHVSAPAHSGVNPQRYFIYMTRRWEIGSTVTVSFKGGNSALHEKIAKAASEWTKYANLKFDFGVDAAGNYRKWSPDDQDYKSLIRIGFDDPQGGYWSLIGKDSADENVVKPGEPSMNFQDFNIQLPSDYAATVIHEFGHAIGFLHEHQSPISGCDAEFKWEDDAAGPGIYTLMAQQGWDKATVDFNMRQMPTSNAYEVGPYDRLSIMHYHFPSTFFIHGASSPCYVPKNVVLSAGDIAGARKAYPQAVADINAVEAHNRSVLKVITEAPHLEPGIKKAFQMQLNKLKDR